MKKTIIVNLYSGPCVGKTTIALGLTYKLKTNGVNCKYVPEYAEELVRREDFNSLKNQLLIYATQHDKLFHLKGKVDVIVTDAPPLLTLSYCNFKILSPFIKQVMIEEHYREDVINLDYYLNRIHPYKKEGRYQDEEEAIQKDKDVYDLLNDNDIEYEGIEPTEKGIEFIYNKIEELLWEN